MSMKIFNNVTIAAGEIATSEPILTMTLSGYQSLQVSVSGNGTIKFYYKTSNNKIDFLTPYGATDILTGITSTSGPDSNGKMILEFSCQFSDHFKIYAMETGGVNSAVVDAWIATGEKR